MSEHDDNHESTLTPRKAVLILCGLVTVWAAIVSLVYIIAVLAGWR